MPTEVAWDVASHRHCKHGERAPGDVVRMHRVPDEERMVVVLADGLGSGIKANVLAQLTATMAAQYAAARHDVLRFAETIRRTLPVCSVRGIGYATFTIADLGPDGIARIASYGNPLPVQVQAGTVTVPEGTIIADDGPGRQLWRAEARLAVDDYLVLVSDGVTQAGLGRPGTPFGWGDMALAAAVRQHLSNQRLPARQLAKALTNQAHAIDDFHAEDDISACVCHRRQRRRLLLVTGPPYAREHDATLARRCAEAPDRVLLAGGTTADIVAREWDREIITDRPKRTDPLPPFASMEGVDLITEGVITLGAALDALSAPEPWNGLGDDQLGRVCRELIDADSIDILLGAGINIAHYDPRLAGVPRNRRQVVEALAKILQERYGKRVSVQVW